MHKTLVSLKAQLEQIKAQLNATIPNDDPFGNAHGNWSFPGLTRVELIEQAQSLIDLIDAKGGDELGEYQARLNDYVRRLQHLHQQTIPNLWNNANQAVAAYVLTLQGLRSALQAGMGDDTHAETVVKQKALARRLRSMEARLTELEPRTASLDDMVERIEQAANAADELPTDLESLSEAREKIAGLVKDATRDQGDVSRIREEANAIDKRLNESAAAAQSVLERCESAYSAATSVGLAAAFSERSDALSRSMWFWIAGLIVALGAGAFFGSAQLRSLSELFRVPDASPAVVALNLLLSALSVGAPVWFAWLSTKQIGQRFRLAEDYAFKASVSRAYEGFRREAARFDEEMEAKLLTSALTRLDELPLRLVETASHGSPWHELATSDTVKQAFKSVPDFAEQVKGLASQAIAGVVPRWPSKGKSRPSGDADSDV